MQKITARDITKAMTQVLCKGGTRMNEINTVEILDKAFLKALGVDYEYILEAVKEKKEKDKQKHFSLFPNNLMDEVFSERQAYSSDQCMGCIFALQALDQREKEIILRYYCTGQTQKQIGEQMGITSSRVSQIRLKTLKKLRHPYRAKFMRFGFEKYREIEKQEAIIEFGVNLLLSGKITAQEAKKVFGIDTERIKIDDLDISKRTYYALRAEGIYTVGRLISYNKKQLKEISGIGEKTLKKSSAQLAELVWR